jgi:hypothetical protein
MYTHDVTRLHHMLDAALDAQSFIEGKTRNDLATEGMQ